MDPKWTLNEQKMGQKWNKNTLEWPKMEQFHSQMKRASII